MKDKATHITHVYFLTVYTNHFKFQVLLAVTN